MGKSGGSDPCGGEKTLRKETVVLTPRVYIHEDCGNLIYAIINYGAQKKKDEALKDFIDCLRYLRTANYGQGPEHYSGGKLKCLVSSGGY